MTSVKQIMSSAVVDVTVKVAAVASLVLAIVVGVRQYELASCLADYNNAAAAATSARSAAADQDRQAEDAMWQAFADASDPKKVPPAQAQKYAMDAFNRFLASRRSAQDQRAHNPLPRPPSQTCR